MKDPQQKPASSAFVALILIGSLFASISHGLTAEGPTRKDLYKYVWDYVIVGDGEATTENLRNIASFFTSQSPESITKLEQAFQSEGLSDRQKRETLSEAWGNVRHGTIVTTSGETYTGILELQSWYTHPRWPNTDSRYVGGATLPITLAKGGQTTVPWQEIVEMEFPEGDATKIKTRPGTLFLGSVQMQVLVHRADSNVVTLSGSQMRRVILGSLKIIECESCFRRMEIDWRFCPFDGTKLK